jgi:glutamyl-tRNA reductase
MQPLVIGVSHVTAPVALRERFSLPSHALESALANVRGRAGECVVLSTCNRFEVYSRLQRETDAFLLVCALTGVDPADARPHLYLHRQQHAVRHLFRVAAGAESLVPGEVEVLGQVRRAWEVARGAETTGPVLSQLFHRAVSLGKRVRSETAIGRRPASVSSAAVQLARQVVGRELRDRHVLIIGSGDVGRSLARCLFEHGARPTVVAHREVERARDLASRYHGRLVTWDRLPEQLARADIVISSTAAPHFVLRHELLERVVQQRTARPLCMIDLAVPRDIEPSVAGLPGVQLHDIDDLRDVIEDSIAQRRAELPRIERMIDAEIARFEAWILARSVAPAIRQLEAEAERIVRSETDRALARLPGASPLERRTIETLASRIAGKLLHANIERIKAMAGDAARLENGADEASHESGRGVSHESADGSPQAPHGSRSAVRHRES